MPARARKTNRRSGDRIEVMEARSVSDLPRGSEWTYEPKWDGFRCVIVRNGSRVHLWSKSQQDLTRYFPEVEKAALALAGKSFVLDGEIVIPEARTFSFDALL